MKWETKELEFSLEFDGCLWEFEARVEGYTPAFISGPPENCYPAEGGEVSLLRASGELGSDEAGDLRAVTFKGAEIYQHFKSEQIEQIEEEALCRML